MTVLAERPKTKKRKAPQTVVAPVAEPTLPPVPPSLPPLDLSSFPEFAGRKRFTRDDCDLLERAGFLSERYELLDGEIIVKSGQYLAHSALVVRIIVWLSGIFADDRVQTQATVEVAPKDRPTNRPKPDVFVLKEPFHTYGTMAEGKDLLLAIEVADSTLRSDMVTKAGLYGRSGIPDYWVIDVKGRRLFIYRDIEDGVYRSVTTYAEADTVAPLAAPDKQVLVSDLFPPMKADAELQEGTA